MKQKNYCHVHDQKCQNWPHWAHWAKHTLGGKNISLSTLPHIFRLDSNSKTCVCRKAFKVNAAFVLFTPLPNTLAIKHNMVMFAIKLDVKETEKPKPHSDIETYCQGPHLKCQNWPCWPHWVHHPSPEKRIEWELCDAFPSPDSCSRETMPLSEILIKALVIGHNCLQHTT